MIEIDGIYIIIILVRGYNILLLFFAGAHLCCCAHLDGRLYWKPSIARATDNKVRPRAGIAAALPALVLEGCGVAEATEEA